MNLNIEKQIYTLTVFQTPISVPAAKVTLYENTVSPFNEKVAAYLISGDKEFNIDNVYTPSILENMLIKGMDLEIEVYNRREQIIAQAEKRGLFSCSKKDRYTSDVKISQ